MPFNTFLVAIVAIIAATLMTVLGPIAKAYARRMEDGHGGPRASGDLDARLARMEQAIESIAVEIERVSEGQRFTTRLLSEQKGAAQPALGDEKR
jgi:hypothetical protein